MTGITIRACRFLFVTGDAPFHIVSVDHFDRPVRHPCCSMTVRAVDLALNVDPMGKDDIGRKLVHPLPGDSFSLLDIADDLQGLGTFADGIARMAGLAEVDIRDSGDTVVLHSAMAEGTVQMGDLFVMDMIEENRLIDRNRPENGKDGIENRFCLHPETMIGDDAKKENDDDAGNEDNRLFHLRCGLAF